MAKRKGGIATQMSRGMGRGEFLMQIFRMECSMTYKTALDPNSRENVLRVRGEKISCR